MRRYIAPLLALTLFAAPARADVPVVDFAGIADRLKSYLQELKDYASYLKMIQNQVQQIQWAADTAQSIIHDPVNGTLSAANMLGVMPDLPINPYTVQGLVSGYGHMDGLNGFMSKFSSLGSLVRGSYSRDNLYTCTNSSFECQQQQNSMTGYSGVKGIGSQLFQDLNNHLPVLSALRERLSTASNLKDVADIQAQISAEQTWTQNTMAQAMTVSMMADAQDRVNRLQANQKLDSDIDAVLGSAPQ